MLTGAVLSVLAQTDAHGVAVRQDVFVVDDASTDNTASVARGFARTYPDVVRYMAAQTGSPARTRNAGAKHATAPFLAFLDDGDEWLPGRLALALDVFAAHPDTALVYG